MADADPDEIYPLLPPEESESRRDLIPLRTIASQAYDEVDQKVAQVDLNRYAFPFENLIFEGGGNKGLAYCGAVRVSISLSLSTVNSYLKTTDVAVQRCC